jgi:hypothetical protein
MHLNPTEYFIYTFGSLKAAATSINRTSSAVCQWRNTGAVPSGAMREILRVAKIKGLDINPDDLLFGRKLKKLNKKS